MSIELPRVDLERLHQQEAAYQPTGEIREQLAGTTHVAIVGARAIGLDYLIRQSGLAIAETVTNSVDPTYHKPDNLRYSDAGHIESHIRQRRFVYYGVRPPYLIRGSQIDDYQLDEPNISAVWHETAPTLHNKGFKAVKTVSVLAPGDQWNERLNERFAERGLRYVLNHSENIHNSVRWSTAQHLSRTADHLLVINDVDTTADTLQRIHSFAHGEPVQPEPDPRVLDIAHQMYTTIRTYKSKAA